MKRPIETALWCDCENDEDRFFFLVSVRLNVKKGLVMTAECIEWILQRINGENYRLCSIVFEAAE